jgi:methionine-gamma-lyase
MAKKNLRAPESQMNSDSRNPEWYLRSIKEPLFQTSTYGFETAEEGERFFKRIYGGKEHSSGVKTKLIYSRFSHPNLISLEEKFKQWENAGDSAFFNTGMAAISNVFLALLKPGDVLLKSEPIYGGTDHFIKGFLQNWGVASLSFSPRSSRSSIVRKIRANSGKGKIAMIYIETPCNPTNDLIDISLAADIAREFSTKRKPVPLVVDNTFLGPVGQRPGDQGADLSVYSASKYLGGHGDLVAGAVAGRSILVQKIKALRNSIGNMADPWTSWLLNRSLETLKIRFEKQSENAQVIAEYLDGHPGVKRVNYFGLRQSMDSKSIKIYNKQCLSPGAMIAFELNSGRSRAFKFLNNLELINLAVSLGGTESNAQHPWTMSHSNVSEKDRNKWGITPSLIRLSCGIENSKDLIADLGNALKKEGNP